MKEKRRRRDRNIDLKPIFWTAGNTTSTLTTDRLQSFAVAVLIQIAGLYFELGLPIFLLLCLYAMIINTGKKEQGSQSAYSVFNKNQESIDGSMSAQQFENEIMRKMY